MSDFVRAKKHLGQHFLNDQNIAKHIVDSLIVPQEEAYCMEIGPGTGVLTQFLQHVKNIDLKLIEVDRESIAYLHKHYENLSDSIMDQDFLKLDFTAFEDKPVLVIGNFPYNISSQILFKVLKHRQQVPQLVGMFQKEVAKRIASGPGNKTYGILSVLLQAYYNIEYLFTVDEHVFTPPPKVKSGVLRMEHNGVEHLACNEQLFVRVVKQAFNQRRKTIRNSVKGVVQNWEKDHELLTKRPEQLNVDQFVELTNFVEAHIQKS